eukprot:Unigene15060_Nuclearia_a/m.45121 Unigene15060_Nuclearia_a/g.45121  ORF Unigene15060_Nuclearia_a/g.45121 Unigene15060_Nuclearia_a/m.45121 type:complete len:243 (+) Unigene15060_Nuclearia_a:50-778(+)
MLGRGARGLRVARRPLSAAAVHSAAPMPSATEKDAEDAVPPGWRRHLARRLNATFAAHPLESMAAVVLIDIATIYGAHTALVAAAVQPPVELAIAFAISRPLRRFRLPVELVVAEGLARRVPWLTHIRVSLMLNAAACAVSRGASAGASAASGGARGASTASSANATASTTPAARPGIARWLGNAFTSAGSLVTRALDRYGVTYTLASRLVGVGVIGALYAALVNGMDVSRLVRAHNMHARG